MMVRRWIRLDAEWDESGWIDALSGQAAGCWPRLLCWVKLRGRKGRCKMPDRSVLARRWRVSRQAVDELIDAALQEGALREDDGDLVISNWVGYQEPDRTATARKRRQRAREKAEKNPKKRHARHGVTPRDGGVTRHATTDRDHQTASTTGNAARDGPDEEGAVVAGPVDQMEAALEQHLSGVENEHERRRIGAQAKMIMSGEDRKAWEADDGSVVPEAERPELFSLALGFDQDGTQRSLRSSVRYVVKLYCGSGSGEIDTSMSPADRKLVKSINDLKDLDLGASSV